MVIFHNMLQHLSLQIRLLKELPHIEWDSKINEINKRRHRKQAIIRKNINENFKFITKSMSS